MNKKIIILIFSLLLISCTHFDGSSKQESRENLLRYSLDNNNNFIRSDGIYTNKRLVNFSNDVKSLDDEPYTKKELDNLDYNKEISFSYLNFRIPSKCEVYKNDDRYFIDFPLSAHYQILIEFNELNEDIDYDDNLSIEDNLLAISNTMSKKLINDGQKLISKPLLNKSDNTPSAYFIIEGKKYRNTHFLVETPTDIIHFIIYEDKELSNSSDNIMADMIKSMFISGEDPQEVIKDFGDYKDELNIYATKKLKIEDLDIKLPENPLTLQDKEDLKVYIQRYNNIVIQEIIIRAVKKDDMSIEDAFNENSGNFIYPAEIITKDRLYTGSSGDHDYIRSKARIYMNDYSLEGDKITIESDDYYITLLIFGPLRNRNSTNIMSTSILNSIE